MLLVIAGGIVAGLLIYWRVDLELHPFAPCWKCRGRNTNRGSRRGAYGLCTHGPRRVRLTGKKAAERHLARVERRNK